MWGLMSGDWRNEKLVTKLILDDVFQFSHFLVGSCNSMSRVCMEIAKCLEGNLKHYGRKKPIPIGSGWVMLIILKFCETHAQ
jgi:hypothetical protein